MTASATPAPSGAIGVGDLIPDVALPDETGTMVQLREAARESTVILFFYPRDGGIRCRTQACAMRDSWPLLRSADLVVYGVNPQDAESHAHHRETNGLPFPLLVDHDMRLARELGFVHDWRPMFKLERSTVIIDPGGRIRAVLRNVKFILLI